MARVKYYNPETGEWEYADKAYDVTAPEDGQNVNPVPKTEDMTQPVGIDADGKLFTKPTTVSDGYINSLIDAKLGVIENGSY